MHSTSNVSRIFLCSKGRLPHPSMIARHIMRRHACQIRFIHGVTAGLKGVNGKLLTRAHPDTSRRRLFQSELLPMSDQTSVSKGCTIYLSFTLDYSGVYRATMRGCTPLWVLICSVLKPILQAGECNVPRSRPPISVVERRS